MSGGQCHLISLQTTFKTFIFYVITSLYLKGLGRIKNFNFDNLVDKKLYSLLISYKISKNNMYTSCKQDCLQHTTNLVFHQLYPDHQAFPSNVSYNTKFLSERGQPFDQVRSNIFTQRLTTVFVYHLNTSVNCQNYHLK